MPQVIDDTRADEGAADGIEGDPPWVAGPFAEQFKSFGSRIDPKHGASEFESLSVLFDDRWVEDAVESVEISVGTPSQRIG